MDCHIALGVLMFCFISRGVLMEVLPDKQDKLFPVVNELKQELESLKEEVRSLKEKPYYDEILELKELILKAMATSKQTRLFAADMAQKVVKHLKNSQTASQLQMGEIDKTVNDLDVSTKQNNLNITVRVNRVDDSIQKMQLNLKDLKNQCQNVYNNTASLTELKQDITNQMLQLQYTRTDFQDFNTSLQRANARIKELSNRIPKCEHGWLHHDNSCYLFSTNVKTWHEAKDYCLTVGAYLTEIQSRDENDFLKGHLLSLFPDSRKRPLSYSIGGHDQNREAHFTWITSGNRFNFTDWYPGEPNNSGGTEDCVHLYSVVSFRWNDFRCSNSMRFICEKNSE